MNKNPLLVMAVRNYLFIYFFIFHQFILYINVSRSDFAKTLALEELHPAMGVDRSALLSPFFSSRFDFLFFSRSDFAKALEEVLPAMGVDKSALQRCWEVCVCVCVCVCV
jgi:hypothetical protein